MGFISDLLTNVTALRITTGDKLNHLWEDIGNKSNLTTTNKTSLVNAINEVNIGKNLQNVLDNGNSALNKEILLNGIGASSATLRTSYKPVGTGGWARTALVQEIQNTDGSLKKSFQIGSFSGGYTFVGVGSYNSGSAFRWYDTDAEGVIRINNRVIPTRINGLLADINGNIDLPSQIQNLSLGASNEPGRINISDGTGAVLRDLYLTLRQDANVRVVNHSLIPYYTSSGNTNYATSGLSSGIRIERLSGTTSQSGFDINYAANTKVLRYKTFDGLDTEGDWQIVADRTWSDGRFVPYGGASSNIDLNSKRLFSVLDLSISKSDLSYPNAINSDPLAWNRIGNELLRLNVGTNILAFIADGGATSRTFGIQVGHSNPSFANSTGILELQPLHGNVRIGSLKGTGDRMVYAGSDGIVRTQAIPIIPTNYVTKNNDSTTALATTVLDVNTGNSGASILYAGASSVNLPTGISGTAGGLLITGAHATVGQYQLYIARGENDAFLYRNQSGNWNRSASRDWTNQQGFLKENNLQNYYTKAESNNQFVNLTAVQTIGGTKTFSLSPVVPNGTLANHAVNKGQLDALPTYAGSNSIILNGGSFQREALIGDVTSPQNSNTLTIGDAKVTYAKFQNLPAKTIFGNGATTAGVGTSITLGDNLELTTDNVLKLIVPVTTQIFEHTPEGGLRVKDWYSTANKPNAIAIGPGSSALRYNALSMMNGALVNGIEGIGIGVNANVSYARGIAFGSYVSDVAGGYGMGEGLFTNQAGLTAVGRYNRPISQETNFSTDKSSAFPIFVIGNGDSPTLRSNSHEFYRDGSSKYYGTQYYNPSNYLNIDLNQDYSIPYKKWIVDYVANNGSGESGLLDISANGYVSNFFENTTSGDSIYFNGEYEKKASNYNSGTQTIDKTLLVTFCFKMTNGAGNYGELNSLTALNKVGVVISSGGSIPEQDVLTNGNMQLTSKMYSSELDMQNFIDTNTTLVVVNRANTSSPTLEVIVPTSFNLSQHIKVGQLYKIKDDFYINIDSK